METSPTVSVIVPVYKTERYLRRCVDSLLKQTFTDYEILLVDDGSPDRSGDICDEYASRDPRVRVFHKANGGVSSARNAGLEHARGQWIAFVDSDDRVEDDFLSPLAKCKGDEGIIRVGHIGEYPQRLRAHVPKKEGIIKSRELFAPGCFSSYSFDYFIQKSIIDARTIRFPEDVSYSEDREFITKCVLGTPFILQIRMTSYFYRDNSESATKKRRSFELCRDDLRVMEHVRDFVEKNGIDWHPSSAAYFYHRQLNSYLAALARSRPKVQWKEVRGDVRGALSQLPGVHFGVKKSLFFMLASVWPALVVYLKYFRIKLSEFRWWLKKIGHIV